MPGEGRGGSRGLPAPTPLTCQRPAPLVAGQATVFDAVAVLNRDPLNAPAMTKR